MKQILIHSKLLTADHLLIVYYGVGYCVFSLFSLLCATPTILDSDKTDDKHQARGRYLGLDDKCDAKRDNQTANNINKTRLSPLCMQMSVNNSLYVLFHPQCLYRICASFICHRLWASVRRNKTRLMSSSKPR